MVVLVVVVVVTEWCCCCCRRCRHDFVRVDPHAAGDPNETSLERGAMGLGGGALPRAAAQQKYERKGGITKLLPKERPWERHVLAASSETSPLALLISSCVGVAAVESAAASVGRRHDGPSFLWCRCGTIRSIDGWIEWVNGRLTCVHCRPRQIAHFIW